MKERMKMLFLLIFNFFQGIQTDLSESWYELIQAIEQRDEKLESAGEIHR